VFGYAKVNYYTWLTGQENELLKNFKYLAAKYVEILLPSYKYL